MACTGGCVNGGGQPIVNAKIMEQIDVRKARAQALYNIDSSTNIRKSHDNPAVKALYQDFLKEPGGHIAHQLLHTHYHERTLYEKK
jgi:iron only hydrogenase large subunit-like protein